MKCDKLFCNDLPFVSLGKNNHVKILCWKHFKKFDLGGGNLGGKLFNTTNAKSAKISLNNSNINGWIMNTINVSN